MGERDGGEGVKAGELVRRCMLDNRRTIGEERRRDDRSGDDNQMINGMAAATIISIAST